MEIYNSYFLLFKTPTYYSTRVHILKWEMSVIHERDIILLKPKANYSLK